jgi:phospholipase C
VPGQEQGVRPARALPYRLNVHGALHSDATFGIHFENVGHAGAVFQVRSANPADVPRTYTVGSGKQLSDTWSATAVGLSNYDLAVYGPNGFFRSFKGGVGNGRVDVTVRAIYDEDNLGIVLTVLNQASDDAQVEILDKYTGKTLRIELERGKSESKRWSLSRSSGWYDFVISVDADPGFENRIAGHIETERDSISDPAMGGLV